MDRPGAQMNLIQALHRNATIHPEAIATIFGERQRTYSELSTRIAKFAAALRSIGIGCGDRVGILALNSDHYVEALFGVYSAKAVINPLGVTWTADEIAYSLDERETHVLIVDDHFAPMVTSLLTRSRHLQKVIFCGEGDLPDNMFAFDRLIEQHAAIVKSVACDEVIAASHTAEIMSCSPRAMVSPHDILTEALAEVADKNLCLSSVSLHVIPMFHCADWGFLNASLVSGATNVILPSFDALNALQTVHCRAVTHTLLTPNMVEQLVNFPFLSDFNLESLRCVAYSGSPMSEGLLRRAMDVMPLARLTQATGVHSPP